MHKLWSIVNRISFYREKKDIGICMILLLIHFSYSTRKNLLWFEAAEPEDCKNAPDEVSHEALPTNMCDEVNIALGDFAYRTLCFVSFGKIVRN